MQPRIYSQNGRMRIDWSRRRVLDGLLSKQWFRGSFRLGGLAIVVLALVLSFPLSGASEFSAQGSQPPGQKADVEAAVPPVAPGVRSIEAFLKRHKVPEANRNRLAKAIVASAKKYDLNSRLLASIMIVESRGNPFAISGKAAVGVMQIHLPTWGDTVDRENINLFKIEDNVDLGARILKNYIRRFGRWEGVKRYNGFIPGDPSWEKSAQTYLTKVQAVYELRQPAAGHSSSLDTVAFIPSGESTPEPALP